MNQPGAEAAPDLERVRAYLRLLARLQRTRACAASSTRRSAAWRKIKPTRHRG
jgi:hypothetical protein